MPQTPHIEPLGDRALLIRWPQKLDVGLNEEVQKLAASLGKAPLPGLFDIVPAYASLALFFENLDDNAALIRSLKERIFSLPDFTQEAPRHMTIPVHYGGAFGPDLDALAQRCGLSCEEVIRRHTAALYRVAMLGFQPGFPYLLGLDAGLAVPRKDTPLLRVPAGSVAIGGAQTGIYPRESPGGWHIIGRTSVVLFDASATLPTLLAPGDRVTFVREAT